MKCKPTDAKTKACVPRYVLTISGSDSSGGAGMQADNRAILADGAFPLNVLTAITLQAPGGVIAVNCLPAAFVEQQLRALLQAYPVAAIKSGMLGNAAIARRVAAVLADFPEIPYLLDPVLRSTSGHPLLDCIGTTIVRERLMPRATLTTPNLDELAILANRVVPDGAAILAAGLALANDVGRPLLVKGGHCAGPYCRDWLLYPDGQRKGFSARRVDSINTRGTGCALSALIAARLARGNPLEDAVAQAKRRLGTSLRAQAQRDWRGAGPAMLDTKVSDLLPPILGKCSVRGIIRG